MRYMSSEMLDQVRFMRQVRAARAILGWSQRDLSVMTKVSLSTLNRLERGDGEPSISTLNTIYKAFEEAGIQFMNNGDNGIGVYLSAQGLARLEKLEADRLISLSDK